MGDRRGALPSLWVLVPLVLLVALAAAALFGVWRHDGNDARAVQTAQDSIAALTRVSRARQDSLDALRSILRVSIDRSVAAAARADSIQAAAELARLEAGAAVDSIASEIHERVDSATSLLVDELVGQSRAALAAAAVELEEERARSAALFQRARSAEELVAELEADRATTGGIISQYEALEAARARQVKSLTWQRNVAGLVALVCAAAC